VPITFNCPCGKALRVADENAGRRVKCPACQAVATVPAPEPDFEVVEDEPKEKLAPKPTPKPAAKPAAKQADEDDEDEDRRGYGVAKSKKKGDDDEDDEPKAKKKPKPRKRPRDDDDDDEDDRPRSRRQSDPDAGKKVMYLIGGLVMLVLGIVIAIYWFQSGPHTGRRPYSGYILGGCLVVVGLGTMVRGITGNFDD
jgi:hypothetical protein